MTMETGAVHFVKTRRCRLAGAGEIVPGNAAGGTFEILAITAGEGNGWLFGADALRESLVLWDGAACFVDHERSRAAGRSVRDLAGVLTDPAWDAERAGVRCRLKPVGPSAPLVVEMGKEVLESGIHKVGFSADVLFSARGREVSKILKVLSVDLVFNPARGGVFLKQFESQGGNQMVEEVEVGKQGETPPVTVAPEAARQLLAVQAQMCGYLLETALASARLPGPAAEQVRRQFAGRAFEAVELERAIGEARKLVSDLTASQVVQGPGRISAMFSSEDRLQAAVDDLLGAPREAGMQGAKVERLHGIRELYLMLTGDDDLHGGYDASRVRLATTADFSGLVKNALNKVVAERWDEMGRAGYNWWEKIVTVEHAASLNDLTGILVGTVGDLPSVAEGAAYTELEVGDSAETASFTKYGGYLPLTLELIDRDETRKLREYPRVLAAAGLRKISSLVSAVFTANAGVGPTMTDTGALFNATAVTTAGGHANLGTTALSAAAWDAAQSAVYQQPMLVKNALGLYGEGPAMAVNPRYLLVPRALQLTGMKILYPSLENAANIYSENQQRGQPGDVITVPEWTDAKDWAAVCDPRVAPAIYIGERFGLRPEIFIAGSELSPAVFMNDEHRLKVRHFLAVMVSDFRPLYKANVA